MNYADVSAVVRYVSSNVPASPTLRLSPFRRPSPPDVDDLWSKRRFVRYGFPGIPLARPTPDAALGGGNPAPNAALTTGIATIQSGVFLAAHARTSSQGDKALPQLFAPLGRVIRPPSCTGTVLRPIVWLCCMEISFSSSPLRNLLFPSFRFCLLFFVSPFLGGVLCNWIFPLRPPLV